MCKKCRKWLNTAIFAGLMSLMLSGCGAGGGAEIGNTAGNAAGMDGAPAVTADGPREIVGEAIEGFEKGTEEVGSTADSEDGSAGLDTGADISADVIGTDPSGSGQAVAASTVRIRMVGDILLHTPVEEASKREDGSYDYSAIFAHTSDLISEADVAMVNQEVIIGGTSLGISGYPAFNASETLMDALSDAGFDVICHGTNHALDKGGKGIRNCIAGWREKYPEKTILGIHDSAEDQDTVRILEVNGIRIAFLNYTYGTNGISLPGDMPFGVDYLDKEKVVSDLAYAEEHADFTVVAPHWGTEYSLHHSKDQEKWARIFLEGGADLVLGTHPHVIQEIEWMEEDSHKMLIYYSLGNFVNWTSGTGPGVANRMLGGMADVILRRAEDGSVFIADYGVIPVVAHCTSGPDGVTVYPLYDYTDELGAQNEIISQAPNFSAEYCRNLAAEIWGIPTEDGTDLSLITTAAP